MVRKGASTSSANKCEEKNNLNETKRQTRAQSKILTLKTKSISKKGSKVKNLNEKNHLEIAQSKKKSHLNISVANGVTPSITLLSKKTESRITRSKTKLNSATVEKDINLNLSSNISGVHVLAHEKKRDLVKRVDFVQSANYNINDIVLAKQKYSIPWPVRILKIEKNKVFVYFFGDKRNGFVDLNQIYHWEQSVDAIKAVLSSKKKPHGYSTGIREVELILGIPIEKSL